MSGLWPWLTLLALGAYHGINPAMGWLFAVALGLQERRRRAVLAALAPIALGHALSIAIVVGLLAFAQTHVPALPLRLGAAAIMLGFGLYRLFSSRHPRWVGMRVGFRDLTLWSFLMASAHGAGLMLVPVLLGWGPDDAMAGHARHATAMGPHANAVFDSLLARLVAVVVHTVGHLLVTGALALLVYEWLGLAVLRRSWFNLDLIWAVTLLAGGVLILLI